VSQSLLVIDDSPDIHCLLDVRLREERVTIHHATSGPEGLQLARERQPDLILLDVVMPGMGGFDVCQELKTDPATADIPVIFLTGSSDSVNKVKGLDLGAVDYIVKPFDVAELRARVRAALRTVRYQKLLAQQAQIDATTGLWNRAHFDRRIREVLSLCSRHARIASLVMMDIDRFKSINDSYGHPFGDRVLEYVSETIRSTSRASDIPCRYGGDELAIILPDTDLSSGRAYADSLRRRVAETPWKHREAAIQITISLGVSCSAQGDGAEAAEALIHRADQALYHAKQTGRNRVYALPAVCDCPV